MALQRTLREASVLSHRSRVSAGMFRGSSVKALPFCRAILLFLHPSHGEIPQCCCSLSLSSEGGHPCWALCWVWGKVPAAAGFCLFYILPAGGTPQAATEGFLWVTPLLTFLTNPDCWEQGQQLWQSQGQTLLSVPALLLSTCGSLECDRGSCRPYLVLEQKKQGVTFSPLFLKLVSLPISSNCNRTLQTSIMNSC